MIGAHKKRSGDPAVPLDKSWPTCPMVQTQGPQGPFEAGNSLGHSHSAQACSGDLVVLGIKLGCAVGPGPCTFSPQQKRLMPGCPESPAVVALKAAPAWIPTCPACVAPSLPLSPLLPAPLRTQPGPVNTGVCVWGGGLPESRQGPRACPPP